MKSKDIAIIVGVALVSAIFSYVLSGFLFKTGSTESYLTAPKVEKITAEFSQPDERYFNAEALNPTKTIIIGDSTNNQPL